MRSLFLAACLSVAAFAAPAFAKNEPDLQVLKINLRGVGSLIVAGFLMEDKGMATVCGVFFVEDTNNATMHAKARTLVDNVYFTVDGRALGITTKAFKSFKSEAEFKAASDKDAVGAVGCARSKRAIDSIKNPASFKIWLRPNSIAE